MLISAMVSARVLEDPTGNAKLAKNSEADRRWRAKDDEAASILAIEIGYREAIRIGTSKPQ